MSPANKILVAKGLHRPSTCAELLDKYGPEIVDHEQIVMHVSTDDASMKRVGTLPSGGPCIVNRTAAEADLMLVRRFETRLTRDGKITYKVGPMRLLCAGRSTEALQ